MRFWISWEQPTADYRPVYNFKKESEPFNHLYWATGSTWDTSGQDVWIMCAVVDAKSEQKTRAQVSNYWPEARHGRFCEQKPDGWLPDSGRFPRKNPAAR